MRPNRYLLGLRICYHTIIALLFLLLILEYYLQKEYIAKLEGMLQEIINRPVPSSSSQKSYDSWDERGSR